MNLAPPYDGYIQDPYTGEFLVWEKIRRPRPKSIVEEAQAVSLSISQRMRNRFRRIRRDLREEIFERDEYLCRYCGCEVNPFAPSWAGKLATLDHVIPLSKGGDNSRSNLVTACRSCNQRKGCSLPSAS